MLKKLSGILLIALLVFNWYGYRVLMNYMEQKASTQLQVKLDRNQYDESTLLEIRVPLNMPYIGDWQEFESFEGETVVNGVHYQYVKRKVERGELVLLCIPNEQKTKLQDAKHNYFKIVNDLQQPTGKKDAKDHAVKIPFSDCIVDNSSNEEVLAATTASALSSYTFVIPAAFIDPPSQPPEC